MKQSEIETHYKKYLYKRALFIIVVLLLLLAMIIFSMVSGSAAVHFRDITNLFTGKSSSIVNQIIINIRLPRITAAILAGTALAISGTVFQSILRNPLASPFTLGISGAAAFGAAFAIIIFGAGSNYVGSNDAAFVQNPYLVTSFSFLWSLVSVAVILLLSQTKGATPEVMILSGIILSSLFSAGISAIQYFSDNIQLASIIFWSFGDLGRATWRECLLLGSILPVALIYFIKQSWNYRALQPGDEYAHSLGVNPKKVRLSGMIVASLVTAVVVSFFGIIAFVGLVVPHIVRQITGNDEQFLIPASATFGAFFLLFCDTLARVLIAPVILPVGILTSFMGAPLFLFLLLRKSSKRFWY